MARVEYQVVWRTSTPSAPPPAKSDVEAPSGLRHLTVRVPAEDLQRLKRLAQRQGIGYTTLVRRLLHAYLERTDLGH